MKANANKQKIKHRPKKHFSQNFLTDDIFIHALCDKIAPHPSDHLVEIGPGLGALSQPLLQACQNLSVIEIDKQLIAPLQKTLLPIGPVNIISQDALKVNFTALTHSLSDKLRIVGNLPYHISTPLLFHLLRHQRVIQDIHVLLQEALIDRIVAKPGTKTYGRLSVMLQCYFSVEKILIIPAEAFYPVPKVSSALLRLIPYSPSKYLLKNPDFFEKVVKLSFSQRRKTLANCLKPLLNQSLKKNLSIDLSQRAESLSILSFVTLANELF